MVTQTFFTQRSQKVRTDETYQPCRWRAHVLCSSAVVQWNTCVAHTVSYIFFEFTVVVKGEHENPPWKAVGNVNAKNVRLAEIYGQFVKVCGEGAVNELDEELGVCCSKKAGQCATACRRTYTRIVRAVQAENFRAPSIQSPCVPLSSLVLLPREMFGWPDSEEWARHKRSCAGLTERLGGHLDTTKAYKSWFHSMPGAWMYVATM
jgi:hypothetical protein